MDLKAEPPLFKIQLFRLSLFTKISVQSYYEHVIKIKNVLS